MLIITIIIFIFLIILVLLAVLNEYLPRWFCDKLGWHLQPNTALFDGASWYGRCPRCKEKIIQDSQGNWF